MLWLSRLRLHAALRLPCRHCAALRHECVLQRCRQGLRRMLPSACCMFSPNCHQMPQHMLSASVQIGCWLCPRRGGRHWDTAAGKLPQEGQKHFMTMSDRWKPTFSKLPIGLGQMAFLVGYGCGAWSCRYDCCGLLLRVLNDTGRFAFRKLPYWRLKRAVWARKTARFAMALKSGLGGRRM